MTNDLAGLDAAKRLIAQMAYTNARVLVTVLNALHAEGAALLPAVRIRMQATLDSIPEEPCEMLLRATLRHLIDLIDIQLTHPESSVRSPEGIRKTFRPLPGGADESRPRDPVAEDQEE